MKFVCEKSIISSVLNDVCRSVASRSSIPALEGIHITVKENILYLESFNIEFGIKSSIEISNGEDGSIVIPAKIFCDIIKKLPDALIDISTQGISAVLRCLDSEFVISCIDPADFPKLPQIEDEKPILIQSDILKNMVKQTIFAVSSDTDQNVHSGELIEVKNGLLTIVAVDGFRMAIRKEIVNNISSDFKIVIPGKALAEILRLLPTDDQDIEIYLSERYAFFKFENYIFLSRLLDGNFLDYESAIPKEFETKVRANAQELIESIERVSVVIDDRLQNPVKAIFKDNSILFSCSTAIGSSNDKIENVIEGAPIEIAFNDRYMVEALKHCDSDKIILQMTSPLKPIKILPTEGEGFIYIVLPVRQK